MKKLLLLIPFVLALTTLASSRRLAGTPPDTWTPSNRMAEVVFWFRSDLLTFSDNGTTPSVNAGIVQQWSNIQGDGNYIMRDTGNIEPLWYTNIQNGKPAVFFNGALWLRNVSDIGTSQLGTIYVVARSTNSTVTQCAWSHGDSADNDLQAVYWDGNAAGDPLAFCELGGGGADVCCMSTTTGYLTTEAVILTAMRASATLHVAWKNGGSAATNTTSATATGSYEGVYIGTNEGGAQNFMGFIFEVIMVSTADTTVQRTQMLNYMDRIWAVPGYP